MNNLAYIFPGQGSQFVGMLSDIYSDYQVVRDTFMTVSDRLGYDVWELVAKDPQNKLDQTEFTQVAMLVADVACYRLAQQIYQAKKPDIMAGHSLGEYPALVCAGALSLGDAAWLVANRGRIMQQSIPLGVGAMAAVIGLDDATVSRLCAESSTLEFKVSPANFNAIGQVVVAGHTQAIDTLMQQADMAGARMTKKIPVSVPCHCELLNEAAELFAEKLQQVTFYNPDIAVISNVDLSIYDTPDNMRRRLKEQLYSPVRWVETIQTMAQKGISVAIECGPGKVLQGLVKRIERSILTKSVLDLNRNSNT